MFNSPSDRLKIVLAGALPPPIGGATVCFELLTKELLGHDGAEVTVVNDSPGDNNSFLRTATTTLGSTIKVLFRLPRTEILFLNASSQRLMLFGALFMPLCYATNTRLILRAFGCNLDTVCEGGGRLFSYLVEQAFKADCILLECRFLVEKFRRFFPSSKIEWFPNSRAIGDAETGPRSSGARRFVFVGHVKPTKGVREILEATASNAEAGIEVDIYGPLLEGFTENEINAVQGASYRGVLKPDEVKGVLRTYDVFLLPSYHDGEGHPGSVLEALHCGLPVIASNWRAIPELISHEESGLLVEPRSSASLSAAMSRLVKDPLLFQNLVAGARQAANQYSSERWNRDYAMELCRELSRGVVDATQTSTSELT